ncbi:MAG TPA: MOSC domain-containing protein [Candidatus Limnocylindrales bacterium]|nr:MOSC domain-containing protein [Candidatus Limnocylindrales bacterium]
MPKVARFNVPHVKGLGLEHPESIDVTPNGVVEDRRFYLIDDTGRLIDGLVAGEVVQFGARTNADGSTLRLTLPDGTVVEDDVRVTDPISTPMYGRTAVGHVVDGPFAAAIEPFARRPVRVVRVDRAGGTREEHHTTIVTDGSLARLAQELGTDALDSRRFRMLIELEGADAHEEDSWLGQTIELGETLLRISAPVARCAITTQDPSRGVRDHDTLRAIKSYRGLREGKNIDFGVWGEVERPGRIRVGDEVRVGRPVAAAG